ncbi:phosphatidylserine/phosphatidylglycerophosphate/cardiolipin synthase-like enzyme [Deinobacterium chartae]|uniref:Phosphatidylserine/phosphatidylglycerophosphate/ cardiolipin synthase-like enzyme n=1 Tax=Deinobacterium chartae TaxID=521158 RepID=A0A841I553_9DEIO|nr:DISARM system phospholipase D-like protein DrmC [Deinobacterium chartae]MBB6099409.1 phosphatidylserine/phosphatidylglycerophosphate/cardiolipin synthase-like enzyme [Deinobacterium chartae]
MRDLLEAVTALVALIPPIKVEAIAARIHGASPAQLDRILDEIIGAPTARAAIRRMRHAWITSGVNAETLAGILLGASHAFTHAQAQQEVDLVWTGPTTPFVPTRRTPQALLQVIGSARECLFLTSFVAYHVPSVVDALNDAIHRGVQVSLLVESLAAHGGTLDYDPIALMRQRVPAARVYGWVDRTGPFNGGKVHAKIAVADHRLAFITSANLTEHAMEKNMEAGVLIHGGTLPHALQAHLQALVDTRVISETPHL